MWWQYFKTMLGHYVHSTTDDISSPELQSKCGSFINVPLDRYILTARYLKM